MIIKKKKPFKCVTAVLKNCNMTQNVVSVHESKKPFKCDICEFICSQSGKLNHHVASVHDGKKAYKCDICNYSFSQKGDMNT